MSILRRLSTSLFFLTLLLFTQAPVIAGIVTTTDIVNAQQVELDRDRLQELLTRADVQEALVEQGVDPVRAQQRVSSMTDMEIQSMAANMDQMPAGGKIGTIELLLIIILIILLV